MWIVKLALSRPYTFIVLALVLILISPVMLLRTPVDIFPNIEIPVISVIWTYTGLAPAEMGTRIGCPGQSTWRRLARSGYAMTQRTRTRLKGPAAAS
jgi:multidrug efflux pump subunit AcrB